VKFKNFKKKNIKRKEEIFEDLEKIFGHINDSIKERMFV
jgi:hypothetical protein